MKHSRSRWALGIAALATVVAFATTADAAPVSKCNAAKKKCIGKYIAAVLGCHAKAEGKGVGVDPGCISKAVAKITGGGKGCFDKNDAKVGNDCSSTGNAAVQLAEADKLVNDVVTAVDPAYPAPTLTKCGAARKKCAGKKAAGLLACAAKANKDGVGDAACAPKITDKFGGAKGCDVNALVKGTDCFGTATTAELETRIDAYRDAADFSIDWVGAACGDGLIEAGEKCDPNGPNNPDAVCGADFPCVACNCACPGKIHFIGVPNDPATQLDVGWTGIAHRSPIISNGDVTVGVSGCAASTRPCGQCNLNGPLPNTGPGELKSQRCTNDTSIQCTTDAPCLGGGGTCQFFFGAPLPLASGGIGTCVVNQFASPIIGTANIESGESYTVALLASSVFSGPTDNPCPQCIGDATINDGVQGGTCNTGARMNLACDGNGLVSSRPDFGTTSFDCPPTPANNIANLSIDLSNGTDPIVKTLSAASPDCADGSGEKCLCETCNNGAAETCSTNADCPDPDGPIGPICGGRRCVGGTNGGAACTNNTECPGGLCGRPGEPSKPGACLDDTNTPGIYDCTDTAPVDGEGECTAGPITKTCSVASGHGQRACSTNTDCGGGAGTCVAANRPCFLTGGFNARVGTNTLIANGVEDPADSLDVSRPILGSVYCVAPTNAAAVNLVAGLPGPSRLTLRGIATGHP